MMGFCEVFGNEAAKKSLMRALSQNRVLNAYVFEGIAGVGKRLLADVFARALVCENEKVAPCDECAACRMAKNHQHPDILYLKNDGGKASIGVDDVREQILNEVSFKPYLGKRRIFIIGEGDILSIEAQNALLKILEEPPPYVTFIICVTKQDKLLETVRSRSYIIPLFPLSANEVEEALKKQTDETEKIELYARLSQGSIGTAKQFLLDANIEHLFEESIQSMLRLKKDAQSVRETADFFISEKEHIGTITDFCQTFLRDCVFVISGLEQNVVYRHKRSQMRVFCEGMHKKGLVSAFDRLTDFKLRLKQNLNYNASVLETVMRIWEDFHDKSSGHQI